MKLTATPFDTQTGELLPVYRDAYLRGDLARSSAQAVEEYLRRDATEAHSVVARWHHLQATEETTMAPTWVGRQLQAMREQPQRFRRRALSLGLVGVLAAGAAMATSTKSVASTAPAIDYLNVRTTVLRGRILNEKGLPLAGATVLQKGTTHGTSTDANGDFLLRVPVVGATTLQYGYGGYAEKEMLVGSSTASAPVVLRPQRTKRRHWLFF